MKVYVPYILQQQMLCISYYSLLQHQLIKSRYNVPMCNILIWTDSKGTLTIVQTVNLDYSAKWEMKHCNKSKQYVRDW